MQKTSESESWMGEHIVVQRTQWERKRDMNFELHCCKKEKAAWNWNLWEHNGLWRQDDGENSTIIVLKAKLIVTFYVSFLTVLSLMASRISSSYSSLFLIQHVRVVVVWINSSAIAQNFPTANENSLNN